MIFFADENLPHKAARLLEVFDPSHEIRTLRDYFEPGTPDIEWLGAIAQWPEKPTVLCGDGRILRNKAESAALRDAQLNFVYLAPGWTQLPWHDFAWKIIKAFPAITQRVQTVLRPTVFRVSVKHLKVEEQHVK